MNEMLEPMLRLEGEHVVLREWRQDEVDAMHRWLGNAEVARFLRWGAETLEESARHLADCITEQDRPDRQRYFLAIELKEAGWVIGDAGFQWVGGPDSGREGRLGYFLEPAYWGHGYATEAADLVLEFAFGTCGAIVIAASCDARNVASERVMQKLGMQREKARETSGRHAYAISRKEWRKRRR